LTALPTFVSVRELIVYLTRIFDITISGRLDRATGLGGIGIIAATYSWSGVSNLAVCTLKSSGSYDGWRKLTMIGVPDKTPFSRTSLKYPEASDLVVAVVTPSDAVMATSAIGSCFLVSLSRWITAPSIGIDCRTEIDLNRLVRRTNPIATAAATAMIVQIIFFAVIQHR
jgi:hypothetical protein